MKDYTIVAIEIVCSCGHKAIGSAQMHGISCNKQYHKANCETCGKRLDLRGGD